MLSKRLAVLFSLCLMLFSTGCEQRSISHSSSSNSSYTESSSISTDSVSSSSQANEVPPAIKLDVDAPYSPQNPVLIVYQYTDGGIYEKWECVGKNFQTIGEIAWEIAYSMNLKDFSIQSVTQEKGTVTVDLSETFLNYDKQQIALFLNTLAMTLNQNHDSFENLLATVKGSAESFGGDCWKVAPLKLLEGDSTLYKAARASFPYQKSIYYENRDQRLDTLHPDAIQQQMAHLLSFAAIDNIEFSNTSELAATDLIEPCIKITNALERTTILDMATDSPNGKIMEQLFVDASELTGIYEDSVWLEEHIAESAKVLYGKDFVLKHASASSFKYLPQLGVYVPPHRGGGLMVLAAILEYSDKGDTVVATVSYALDTMGGFTSATNWEESIPESELVNHLKNTAKRYTVTFGKDKETSSLYILSQVADKT